MPCPAIPFLLQPRTALVAVGVLSALACSGGRHDRRAVQVPDAKPELTRLLPNRGYPGTEVVMEGHHLAKPLQVSYQGQPLAADRWEVQGDTRILVRLPDEAQGEAILSVTHAAGTSGKYFFVKPCVREVLQQPFVPVYGVLRQVRMLDFPTYRRTTEGARLQLPTAPVFAARQGASAELGQGCALNLQLPAQFWEVLPASVQALVKELGIEPYRVAILCVSQRLGEDGGAQVFHPHAWLEAAGGTAGPHPQGFKVGVALREQAYGLHFEGHDPQAFLELAAEAPFPADLAVTGLPPQGSTAFWSVTRFGAQAAATLHLLLSEQDHEALAGLAAHADHCWSLLEGLAQTPLKDAAVFQPFQALFRPQLAGYGRAVANPDPELTTLHVNGTGLAGTRAVTVGGQPVKVFEVLTDGLMRLTIPKAWAGGALVVTTNLGTSDPVALPAVKA